MSETQIEYIKPSSHIYDHVDPTAIIDKIETCAAICYQSDKPRQRGDLIKRLISSDHHSSLEHVNITAYVETSRAVAMEWVRHRLASYSMASQRYISYNKKARFVVPVHLWEQWSLHNTLDNIQVLSDEWKQKKKECRQFEEWSECIRQEYEYYCHFIGHYKEQPQQARSVLPNACATQLYCTMNLRSWKHFFDLRWFGTTGAPDPNMKATVEPLYKEFSEKLPFLFAPPSRQL